MYFVLEGLSPGREHLWAPRLITYGRGAVTCTTGWSRRTQHNSLSESVVWTRLGYFLRFGCCWYVPHCVWVLSQVHASFCVVLIGSMDGWWVIVECGWWIIIECECWIMNIVYAHHVCLCSLLIVVILDLVLVPFIMNSPLQFYIVWLITVMITNIVRGSRMTAARCRE